MTVTPFPAFSVAPIAAPADIAAIEAGLAALCGAVTASGGFVALAGRDLLDTPLEQRAAALTRMYDAGEVVVGWRDGQAGLVTNVVVQRVTGPAGEGYAAEVYVEEADGHVLRGVLAERDPADLCRALSAVAAGDPRAPLPGRGAALARLVEGG